MIFMRLFFSLFTCLEMILNEFQCFLLLFSALLSIIFIIIYFMILMIFYAFCADSFITVNAVHVTKCCWMNLAFLLNIRFFNHVKNHIIYSHFINVIVCQFIDALHWTLFCIILFLEKHVKHSLFTKCMTACQY